MSVVMLSYLLGVLLALDNVEHILVLSLIYKSKLRVN